MSHACLSPRLALPVLASLVLPLLVAGRSEAQPATPVPTTATAPGAPAGQFDFLLGDWQVEARPKVSSLVALIHGTPVLPGSWHASRAADGGIDDELRLSDSSGNPISTLHAHRLYVAGAGHWQVDSRDVARGRHGSSQGTWSAGTLRLDGSSTDSDGSVSLVRLRYFAISATDFDVQQDRSEDQGRSWEEASLVIHAHRTAAAAP